MSSKSQKIAALVQFCRNGDLDPRYAGFFECFNRQLFFEAHEVLENLWLAQRGKSKGLFYKGLIQLAGAFVHVQKKRWKPAAALFELARVNLHAYSPVCDQLEIASVVELIKEWLELLRTCGPASSPLVTRAPPVIRLSVAAGISPAAEPGVPPGVPPGG